MPPPRRGRRPPAPCSATSKRAGWSLSTARSSPELSDVAGLEPGLAIGSLADALADGDPTLAAHLGKLAPASDVAVALNTALMGDGAVIRIAAGATIERPLHLLFVASAKPAATFVRSLVVVEQGARAMLIESHEGPAGSDYQVNAALEIVCRRRGPCRSRQDHRRGRRRAARLDAGGGDRRAGALQRFHLHRRRRRGAQPAVPEIRRRGHRRRHPRRHPDQGPAARRHHAGRRPRRARLPEPRNVQDGARRRGPRRVPGPHHRAAAARRRPTPR